MYIYIHITLPLYKNPIYNIYHILNIYNIYIFIYTIYTRFYRYAYIILYYIVL